MRIGVRLRSKLVCLQVVAAIILLSACGTDEPRMNTVTVPPVHSTAVPAASATPAAEQAGGADGYSFPPTVDLSFQTVEMTPLVPGQAEKSWERTARLDFGSVNGEPVSLAMYKDTSGTTACNAEYERVAVLAYKQQQIRYPGCFSSALDKLDPAAPEAAEEEEASSLFAVLEYRPEPEGARTFYAVQGAAALSGNGPGRKAYFVLATEEDRWYGFEDWGDPSVADLDGDGASEIVVRFRGQHLSRPDLWIYRWRANGALERCLSVKGELGLPGISASHASWDEGTGGIRVSVAVGAEPDRERSAQYRYENGKLVLEGGGETAGTAAGPVAPPSSETPKQIAALPDKGIYLYGAEDGVILKMEEREQAFPWIYGTPRNIEPVMSARDWDGDGQEETAIILNVGSGTGVSVYELHMVEIGGAAASSPFIASTFQADDYINELLHAVQFRTATSRQGKRTALITIGKQTSAVDLAPYPTEEYGEPWDHLAFGNIASFAVEKNRLKAVFGVGLPFANAAMPEYIGYIYADVAYEAGAFSLKNLAFHAERD